MSDDHKTNITGDHNIAVVGNQNSTVNINVPPAAPPKGKRFTLFPPPPKDVILDRSAMLEELHRRFRAGKRWVVISAKEGAGKTALATFYYKDEANRYVHTGWVDFKLTLFHSYVNALATGEPEVDVRKGDDVYYRQAYIEALRVNDMPGPKLLVIDNVPGAQAVLDHIGLLELENTDILLTAPAPFQHPYFEDYLLPRIGEDELRRLFVAAFDVVLKPAELNALRDNIYLVQLLLHQAPKDNLKLARNFFREISAGLTAAADRDGITAQVTRSLLRQRPLDAARHWLLLCLAALPPGLYEADALALYLAPESDDPDPDLDLAWLSGYQVFSADNPSLSAPDSAPLSELLEDLAAAGWLSASEGEAFAVHGFTARAAAALTPPRIAWLPELAAALELNFFKEEFGWLKDDLQYYAHLHHFLQFMPEEADETYLSVLWKMIGLCEDKGRWGEELEWRRKHLSVAERVWERRSLVMADKIHLLGETLRRMGLYQEAFLYIKEAYEIAGLFYGDMDAGMGAYLSEMGSVYQNLGNLDLARDFLEKTLDNVYANYDAGHRKVAASQSNLANVYKDLGRYEEAAELLRAALDSDLKNFGKDHPDVARCQSNLALVYQDLGRYEEAAELLRAALDSDLKNFGKDHPKVAIRQSNLALVYKALGRYEEAAELLRAALESDLKNFGKEHPNVATDYNIFGWLYLDLQQHAKAKAYFEKALAIFERVLPAGHPHIATVREGLEEANRLLSTP